MCSTLMWVCLLKFPLTKPPSIKMMQPTKLTRDPRAEAAARQVVITNAIHRDLDSQLTWYLSYLIGPGAIYFLCLSLSMGSRSGRLASILICTFSFLLLLNNLYLLVPIFVFPAFQIAFYLYHVGHFPIFFLLTISLLRHHIPSFQKKIFLTTSPLLYSLLVTGQ